MAKSDNAYTFSYSKKKMERFPATGHYNVDKTALTKMFKTEEESGFQSYVHRTSWTNTMAQWLRASPLVEA